MILCLAEQSVNTYDKTAKFFVKINNALKIAGHVCFVLVYTLFLV